MKMDAGTLRRMKGITAIPVLTAYTCPIAKCLEAGGVPVILVGDTVGMVEMGFDSTRVVTIEHMEYHIGAVRRGAPSTHIIGDLPFNTDVDPKTALKNANRLIAAGADSIKLEGPKYKVIRHLVANGLDVVGHVGLTPQTAQSFAKVGQTEKEAQRVSDEARGIEAAGAFMVVLEHIPSMLGRSITSTLSVPTIGIGAGATCDGQVLVINDVLGIGDYWPPFSKQYAHLSELIVSVAQRFAREVKEHQFPVDNSVV